MIQAFTADRTDETLGVGILPGGKDAATIKPGGGESSRVRGNEGRLSKAVFRLAHRVIQQATASVPRRAKLRNFASFSRSGKRSLKAAEWR